MNGVRLTERGENLVLGVLATVKVAGVLLVTLAVMGTVGWIEGAGL